MGLIAQIFRGLQEKLRSGFNFVFRRNKKTNKKQPAVVPESWIRKKKQPVIPQAVIIKHKKRIPHLLFFKRLLAGFLLLVNFVFSQVLLGSVGTGAQPMFVLFLLNSFILIDYLWKTRRAAE